MEAREWIERTAWERRGPEFGQLGQERGEVTMGFANQPGSPITVAPMLEELWRMLPAHPGIIEMVAPYRLKYAAIDWDAPQREAALTTKRLSGIGILLIRAFQFLQKTRGTHQLAWFLCPLVYIDSFGEPRFAFGRDSRVVEPVAPEVFDRWPNCEPPAIVFAIGHLLRRLMPHKPASTLSQLIQRCIERDVKHRVQSLHSLESSLHESAKQLVFVDPRSRKEQRAFDMLERGRGFLDLGRADLAAEAFEEAQSRMPDHALARSLLHATRRFVAESLPPELRIQARPARGSTPATWADVAARGAQLERERDFGAAVLLYRRAAITTSDEQVECYSCVARCYFHIGDHALAIAYADHALDLDPALAAALEIKCHALILRAHYDDALGAATNWCAVAAGDPDAHYARGKALLGLKRYPDARDAFERALAIDPKLVEAMLLRRQVDIAMKNTRARVGSPVVMPLDIPDDLPELRAAMVGGKLDEALASLAKPALAQHAAAQLYRGQILFFLERYDEALAVLSTLQSGEARYARARVLTAMDRYEEALAELDVIREKHPEITDAAATRAYVLDALGRPREADAAESAYLESSLKHQ